MIDTARPTTSLRLASSDEAALIRKIKAGTATMIEESTYGEVLRLREAVTQYARRLAVAYPAQTADLYDESRRIMWPQPRPLASIRPHLTGECGINVAHSDEDHV